MHEIFDPMIPILGLMIPIVAIVGGITAGILRQRAIHTERMAMIEQGFDPDERARQHKERMAMIKHGLDPDRLALEEGDLDRDPELIER